MLHSIQQSVWFIFQNEHVLCSHSTSLLLDEGLVSHLRPHFLRTLDVLTGEERICCSAELPLDLDLPAEVQLVPLKKAFSLLDEPFHYHLLKAYSAINWDKNHQFCGGCGAPTLHTPGAFERKCTHCHLTFYPRISPSVIVLIRKGSEVLMARSPHFAPGVYGLIAGFVEIGESLEEAVRREVKEEVNIEIKNLAYFRSQPWPFPDSLMMGFTADYASGDLKIDEREIEAAGWYRYDQLPGRPSVKLSIASKLLDDFIQSQE